MKYHDSIKEADQKLTLTVKQLRIWNLAASPINYAVTYEYIHNKNSQLIQTIDHHVASGKSLDSFLIEELYQQHVMGQSSFRDTILADIEGVISTVEDNSKKTMQTVNGFASVVDNNLVQLQSRDQVKSSQAMLMIKKASQRLKQQQKLLAQQLASSQQQTLSLKAELEETRKEVYLDPLTRFYNKTAMSNHLDAWLTEDPERKVAAIVINVDHFSQFNHKFGPLISDVLLSKIANKVSSYVDDSGVAVRSAGDEFIILFPDLEKGIAQEIALKIRQGVEKLRFVSSKSGIRLPQMTVSVGVEQFNVAEKAESMIKKSRNLLLIAAENLSRNAKLSY